MANFRPRAAPVWGALLLVAGSTALWPRSAEARGTYFVLELNGGLSESAYQGGDLGMSYGLATGLTFKPVASPLRFHFLMAAAGRTGQALGAHSGIPFSLDQHDLDVYGAGRVVLPIFSNLRVYGELGVGQRWMFQTVRRSEDLGSLSVSSNHWLGVTAIGLQARLTQRISAGVRAQFDVIDPGLDLVSEVTGLEPESWRFSTGVQIGFHF